MSAVGQVSSSVSAARGSLQTGTARVAAEGFGLLDAPPRRVSGSQVVDGSAQPFAGVCRCVGRDRNEGVADLSAGELLPDECDAGHEVLAQLSGRMRRFRIKVVPGDRVTVGVSPYDPVRGIITFRAR